MLEDLRGGQSAAASMKLELRGQSKAHQNRVREFVAKGHSDSSHMRSKEAIGKGNPMPEGQGSSKSIGMQKSSSRRGNGNVSL